MTKEIRHTPAALTGGVRMVLALVVCALIAAIVEVGVFNLDWVTSLGSSQATTITLSDSSTAKTVQNSSLTLNGVDAKVSSVRLQFADGQWHDVAVNMMDESQSTFRKVGTIHESDQPLYLHADGNVRQLRLDADNTTLGQIESVTLNGIAPLNFLVVRWAVVAFLLFAFWLLRPASALWNQRVLDYRRAFPICACVMCAIALAASCSVLSTYVLDGFDFKGLNQYTDLARALAGGQVYLDIQPSEGLLALSNPYDIAAREGVDYMWDYAFFNGRYYTYFGIIPCLLFYLPYYLLTGGALQNIIVSLGATFAFYAGFIYLCRRLIGRWFPKTSVAAFLLCALLVLFGTMSLSLVSLPTIYPVPIACGAACAIWGVALWLRAVEGKRFSWGYALAGSLIGALTLGCRPQFFLIFLFVLVLFIDAVQRKLVKGRAFFVLVAPIVVIGLLICAYNYARFGSLVDFGSSYNLTNDDMSKHGLSAYVGALGVFGFLLQPPQIIGDWPFVTGVNLSYAQNSDLVIEQTFGGLFAIAPLTLAAFWFFWNKRLRQQRILLIMSAIGLCCGVLLAVVDICAGGLILRYAVDMGLFIALAACIGILALTSELLPEQHEQPEQPRQDSPTELAEVEAVNTTANLRYAVKLGLFVLACATLTISMLYFFSL